MDEYTLELDAQEEVPIPYAPKADFVKSLLNFDSADLDMEEQQPEVFLLNKTCELKKWSFSGRLPRYFVEHWVELCLVGPERFSYRVLNARAHRHMSLTMDHLMTAIQQSLHVVNTYQTDLPRFLKELFIAYDILHKEAGDEVALAEVYDWIYHRHPRYKREQFGLDLNRLLASGALEHDGKLCTLTPAEKGSKDTFFLYDEDKMRVSMASLSFK